MINKKNLLLLSFFSALTWAPGPVSAAMSEMNSEMQNKKVNAQVAAQSDDMRMMQQEEMMRENISMMEQIVQASKHFKDSEVKMMRESIEMAKKNMNMARNKAMDVYIMEMKKSHDLLARFMMVVEGNPSAMKETVVRSSMNTMQSNHKMMQENVAMFEKKMQNMNAEMRK